jgi:hypothetical protein
MLSIRLSDDEYHDIKDRCRDAGDLTVSEFVRAAMIGALESSAPVSSGSVEVRLSQLYRRLERVERQLEAVARRVVGEFNGT